MPNRLKDRHNRIINSVRISVTDRCNFKCIYCMPDGLVNATLQENILTYEEILRLVRVLYNTGIKKVRLTGGEPTIRRDFVSLCKMLTTSFEDLDLAITTNGVHLPKMAKDLWDAGVRSLNISLDTLDHKKFHDITRRDELIKVMNGIDTSLALGFKVKINAVSIKTFNDDEKSISEFLELSKRTGIQVRFIELMPFTGNEWNAGKFISSADMREKIAKFVELQNTGRKIPSQTSTNFQTHDGAIQLGFISSVSETFCSSCDRIRITADGALRPCLHSHKEYPLRDIMRDGVTDEQLLNEIKKGLSEKWKEHPDFLSLNYLPPMDDREMIRIGG